MVINILIVFLILNIRLKLYTYSNLRSADNKHDFRPYVSFRGFAF